MTKNKETKSLQKDQTVLNKKYVLIEKFLKKIHKVLQILLPCGGAVVVKKCGWRSCVVVLNDQQVSFSYLYHNLKNN